MFPPRVSTARGSELALENIDGALAGVSWRERACAVSIKIGDCINSQRLNITAGKKGSLGTNDYCWHLRKAPRQLELGASKGNDTENKGRAMIRLSSGKASRRLSEISAK